MSATTAHCMISARPAPPTHRSDPQTGPDRRLVPAVVRSAVEHRDQQHVGDPQRRARASIRRLEEVLVGRQACEAAEEIRIIPSRGLDRVATDLEQPVRVSVRPTRGLERTSSRGEGAHERQR